MFEVVMDFIIRFIVIVGYVGSFLLSIYYYLFLINNPIYLENPVYLIIGFFDVLYMFFGISIIDIILD